VACYADDDGHATPGIVVDTGFDASYKVTRSWGYRW